MRGARASLRRTLRTGITGHAICCFLAERLTGAVCTWGLSHYSTESWGGGAICVFPSVLLDGSVFIAWYKYNQKVHIKLCYYCSTKLEMLEVLASWLFHAAMNILWERKYLVSDSFYSAATHRLVTFQISPKSKLLPIHLFFLYKNPLVRCLAEVSILSW